MFGTTFYVEQRAKKKKKNPSPPFSEILDPPLRSDYLSKIVDHDDWSVSDALFRYVESVWGPYDLDLFASYYNAKVGRFCSRFWNPNAFAIDAFSIDWNGYNLWIVPPVHIIARAILYLAQCQGYGTLIVPVWSSASFWPILHSDRISQFVRGFASIYLRLNHAMLQERLIPGCLVQLI